MMNLIKLLIFHQNIEFSSKSWIFIIMMTFLFKMIKFYQNDDLSPHWLSSVKTINLYHTDEFHNIDEFSSLSWLFITTIIFYHYYKFHKDNYFSSNVWIFIQQWIFITKISFSLQSWIFLLQPWVSTLMINFQSDDEFLLKWRIFIKTGNFRYIGEFSS